MDMVVMSPTVFWSVNKPYLLPTPVRDLPPARIRFLPDCAFLSGGYIRVAGSRLNDSNISSAFPVCPLHRLTSSKLGGPTPETAWPPPIPTQPSPRSPSSGSPPLPRHHLESWSRTTIK